MQKILTQARGGLLSPTRSFIAEGLARPAPAPAPDDLHLVARPDGARVTEAAVLVPLVDRNGRVQLLLTQRTPHLDNHAGQISFPGGRADPGDADVIDTALRETQEEVGLPRERVQVLGPLNTYSTVSSYVVTPIVGLVQPPFELALDAFEVAEAFEVPLQYLMTPAHHRRHAAEFEGVQRQFLSMPWQSVDAQGRPREYFIWGATAAMLRNLYHFLR